MNDLRFAVRQLVRRPALTGAAIATIALAIGANTAIFSVVNGVLLRPLPYAESDRLVTVWLTYPHWRDRDVLRQFWDAIRLAYPEYERLRDGAAAYESVSIYRAGPMAFAGAERAEQVTVGSADDALPAVLRVGPSLGRWFARAEVGPGGARVAVLTDAFWQTRLGGDPAVLGRAVRLDDDPYTVIGVLPPGVRFGRPNQVATPDVWIPVGALPVPLTESNHAFDAIARLAPGATLERAQEETAALLRGDRDPATRGARVVLRKDQEVAGVRSILYVLWGAVGVILLIACVNVANLLLGRTAEREHELAVRHALGADRRRIARHVLVESLTLAVAGGALGVLLVGWGMGALTAMLPADLPRRHEIGIDGVVLGFSLGATLLTGLLFGVLPSLVAGARAGTSRVRQGARHVTPGGVVQRGLVAVQVALTIVLLVGAGLLTRTLTELWRVDPGFERDGRLTFQLSLPPTRYADDAAVAGFYARVEESLAALPGVAAVATTSVLPLSGQFASNSVWPASYGPEEGAKPEVQRRIVSPGYLRALGVPLLRGRAFTEADAADAELVMLVSRMAADRLWEGRDPIGDRIEMSRRWWTVVGVVEDVRDRTLAAAPEPTVYVPSGQWPAAQRTLVLGTEVAPLTLAASVRAAVGALDPELPVTALQSMEQVAAVAVAAERFRARLVGALAVLALLLAVVGLYGVMNHGVARRTREIGVRMALGARPGRVVGQVLRRAGTTVGLGLIAGVLVAVPASRLLRAFLFGVPALDPTTYAVAALAMAAAALLASWLPARRAARIDPMDALRHE